MKVCSSKVKYDVGRPEVQCYGSTLLITCVGLYRKPGKWCLLGCLCPGMGQECPTSCLLFGWKILPGDGVLNQVQVAISRQLQTVCEPVYRITGVNISTVVGDCGAGAGDALWLIGPLIGD